MRNGKGAIPLPPTEVGESLLDYVEFEYQTERIESMTDDRTSILDMAMGAIKERADYEMARIIDNILDPNTDPKKKRKLVLTLELVPDSERKTIGVNRTAKSTLAATNPVCTSMYVTAAPGTGEVQVVEMVPQIPGQQSMDGDYQDEPKVLNFKRA